MSSYVSYEKYIAKCDSCYSLDAVPISKTIYDTDGADPVKICKWCVAQEKIDKASQRHLALKPASVDDEPF